VAQSLAKDPAQRFPTCRDFVRALRQAIEQSATLPPGAAGPSGLKSSGSGGLALAETGELVARRRSVALTWGAGLSLAGLATVLGWFAFTAMWSSTAGDPKASQQKVELASYDPNVHRRLPPGLTHKPGTHVEPSGWPMEVVSDKDGAEMVLVPAGSFQMGGELQDDVDARPVHEVRLSAFYIDRYEVTNAQFGRFVDEKQYRDNDKWQLGADGGGITDKDKHPVVWVKWQVAQAYAEWAGKQLPTEAQWERAAKGNGPGPFPWGETLPRGRANYKGAPDGFDTTAPVGRFPEGVSPFGCHDMAGNASEWCRDWFGEYPKGTAINPQGPGEGEQRVLRGGSWDDDFDTYLSVVLRIADYPYNADKRYGFRCVYELPEDGSQEAAEGQ
jgi:formylglycine-generating enzyme required for sulfatase activity